MPGTAESGVCVVLMSAIMLAEWLEGTSFAQPDATHTRVVTLEAVLPVGYLNIQGVMVPSVDLVFKETITNVEVEAQEAPPEGAD